MQKSATKQKAIDGKTEVTVLTHLFGNLEVHAMLLEKIKINTVTMLSYRAKTE